MASNDPRITILDRATVAPGMKMRPIVEAAWQQRYNARRYIFSKEASGRIGEMMANHVDLMVDNIEFARTPYPTTYLEFDCIEMWRHWRPSQLEGEHGQKWLASCDTRVGFLVHQGSVVVMSTGNRPDTQVDRSLPKDLVAGMTFRINRPQSVPYTKLVNMSEPLAEQVKNAYVFGGQRGYSQVRPGGVAPETFNERTWVFLPDLKGVWTHTQVAAHFDVMPSFLDCPPPVMTRMSFLGGGDPMVLTVMLLLLNQPSKFIRMDKVERGAGLYKGKRKVFQEHVVVHVHLDPAKRVSKLFAPGTHATPAWHEVEAHWRNFNKSDWCNHHKEDGRQAWEPVGEERDSSGQYKRYWCPLCLQRRTRIELPTGRGDPLKGVNTKEYHVEP